MTIPLYITIPLTVVLTLLLLTQPADQVNLFTVGLFTGFIFLLYYTPQIEPLNNAGVEESEEEDVLVQEPCKCNKYKFEYTNDFDRLSCMFKGQKNTCAMKNQSSC